MSVAALRRAMPLLFTGLLVALVIAAQHEPGSWRFTLVVALALCGASAALLALFPDSRFFALALANGLAVYACAYTVFVRANFPDAEGGVVRAGFALPVLAFIVGTWRRRARIREIIAESRAAPGRVKARGAAWLAPLIGIGLLSFVFPNASSDYADLVLMSAMLAVAAVVFAVSPDVATFLIDAGLLFDEFFARARRLAVPAFAFLTFYSMIVIGFASIYQLMARADGAVHFLVDGRHQRLDFSQSLYFSLMTMATVGYGDITPTSEAARMVAAIQVVLGVLLLLFGFSELMSYAREPPEQRGRPES
jgi:voltage-gated potassium channel